MSDKKPQAVIYEQLSAIGSAFSNPHRLKMINLLAQGEKAIDELAQLTGQSLALASANVKVLRNCRLISTEKRGRSMYCRLASPKVAALWLSLRDLGPIVMPEIREVMRENFDKDPGLSPLTADQLKQKLGRSRLQLLDLRPATEYSQGHLPTARNVPFEALEKLAPDLPRSSELLVYCRGPFCAAALEGNNWLRANKFRSQRLSFSLPEWQAAGLPVETPGEVIHSDTLPN